MATSAPTASEDKKNVEIGEIREAQAAPLPMTPPPDHAFHMDAEKFLAIVFWLSQLRPDDFNEVPQICGDSQPKPSPNIDENGGGRDGSTGTPSTNISHDKNFNIDNRKDQSVNNKGPDFVSDSQKSSDRGSEVVKYENKTRPLSNPELERLEEVGSRKRNQELSNMVFGTGEPATSFPYKKPALAPQTFTIHSIIVGGGVANQSPPAINEPKLLAIENVPEMKVVSPPVPPLLPLPSIMNRPPLYLKKDLDQIKEMMRARGANIPYDDSPVDPAIAHRFCPLRPYFESPENLEKVKFMMRGKGANIPYDDKPVDPKTSDKFCPLLSSHKKFDGVRPVSPPPNYNQVELAFVKAIMRKNGAIFASDDGAVDKATADKFCPISQATYNPLELEEMKKLMRSKGAFIPFNDDPVEHSIAIKYCPLQQLLVERDEGLNKSEKAIAETPQQEKKAEGQYSGDDSDRDEEMNGIRRNVSDIVDSLQEEKNPDDENDSGNFQKLEVAPAQPVVSSKASSQKNNEMDSDSDSEWKEILRQVNINIANFDNESDVGDFNGVDDKSNGDRIQILKLDARVDAEGRISFFPIQ